MRKLMIGNIPFGRVWGASGVQGFFGEGYWFHKWLRPFGLSFEDAVFVAKTSTLEPRQGNMELTSSFTPAQMFPDCVWMNIPRGIALNAVGLSGPGLQALLDTGLWQAMLEPFSLSVMAVGVSRAERMVEYQEIADVLREHLPHFKSRFCLQVNIVCPNTGHDLEEIMREAMETMNILAGIGVPLMPKLNFLARFEWAEDLSKHKACGGLCISNTIRFQEMPGDIRRKYFGKKESPLAKYSGGGLSGKPLLPYVIDWVRHVKLLTNIKVPIIAGGGILNFRDAARLVEAGADGIFIGSMAMLRPWRVQDTIRNVHQMYEEMGVRKSTLKAA